MKKLSAIFPWKPLLSFVALAGTVLGCARPPLAPWQQRPEGPAAIANEYLETSVGKIRLLRSGDPAQPRIIYAHGTPGSSGAWMDYLEYPIEGFEAVSLDRLGFGHSEAHRSWVSLRAQAASIEPLLVERDGQWPILVGHSLGGAVIAEVAARYPDRVGGLVIVAGSLDPDLEEILWIQHVGATRPFVWLIPRALRHANEEIFAFEDELRQQGAILPQIRCPVVIVHGTKDSLVPLANVDFMRRAFPEGTIRETVILEGRNHFLPWNSADEVRGAIVRLASQIAESSAEADPSSVDAGSPSPAEQMPAPSAPNP
jgi:pimeloyl-ACP methyl ester carboxylesterase